MKFLLFAAFIPAILAVAVPLPVAEADAAGDVLNVLEGEHDDFNLVFCFAWSCHSLSLSLIHSFTHTRYFLLPLLSPRCSSIPSLPPLPSPPLHPSLTITHPPLTPKKQTAREHCPSPPVIQSCWGECKKKGYPTDACYNCCYNTCRPCLRR